MQHLLNLINLNLLYKCEFQFLNKIQIAEIRITRIQEISNFFLMLFSNSESIAFPIHQ